MILKQFRLHNAVYVNIAKNQKQECLESNNNNKTMSKWPIALKAKPKFKFATF